MIRFPEDAKLWLAIAATTLVKYLFTEEEIPEDETADQRRTRRKKYFGGGIAGIAFAYFGHATVAGWLGIEDPLLLVCVMVLTGEQFTLAALKLSTEDIKSTVTAVMRRRGGRSE